MCIWLLSSLLNLVVVAVLCDSVGIRYVIAVLCDRLLWGWALCLNHNKEDYYYYYYYYYYYDDDDWWIRRERTDTNPRQLANLISIEHEFLERVGVAQNIVGHREQVAVSLIDVIDLLVAGLEQRQAAQHHRRGRGRRRAADAAAAASWGQCDTLPPRHFRRSLFTARHVATSTSGPCVATACAAQNHVLLIGRNLS